jgi:alpha-tubulin suppressor-like RCC1 family protein
MNTRQHREDRVRTKVRRVGVLALSGLITTLVALVGGSANPASADPAPAAFVQLAVSQSATCGLTGDGDAYCWGTDVVGQLGNGPATADSRSVPSPVDTPAGVTWARLSGATVGLEAVRGIFCGVTTTGAGYCWGSDANGKLGNGPALTDDQVSPSPIATPPGVAWQTISPGTHHVCALTTGGAIYCWGPIQGAFTDVPDLVPGGPWASVSSGGNMTCAVSVTGAGSCWGNESFGEFGDGLPLSELASSPNPIDTPAGVTWASITAGNGNACGITTTGAAYCWGIDNLGGLGNGPAISGSQPSPTPVDTPAGVEWTQLVRSGLFGGCGLTTSGEIYCWGRNDTGQLGIGSTDVNDWVESPTLISTPPGVTWSAVASGGDNVCATAASGETYCWGANESGQLGDRHDGRSGRRARGGAGR